MASGALCVTAPSLVMMLMLCVEWQASLALSVSCIIPDMVEDRV